MKKHCSLLMLLVGLAITATPVNATELVVKSKTSLPPPQLGIAPPRVEKTVAISQGKRFDQSIVLYNYNNKPKTIELSLFDTNKQHKLIKPQKNTLSPWAIINPTHFTIPANGEQTIRISIRPPLGFPQKTHYAMLKINHKIENPVKMDKAGKSVTVSLGSSYGLPIIVKTK